MVTIPQNRFTKEFLRILPRPLFNTMWNVHYSMIHNVLTSKDKVDNNWVKVVKLLFIIEK